MLKVWIIVFLSVFALIDIVAIFGPSISKAINNIKRAKRRKAFAKKMKDLEIK